MPLLELQDQGLYCEAGDFFIDPWDPVDRALVTHAHADHARPGSRRYLVSAPSKYVSRLRLGEAASIETIPYGEARSINGVKVSFHPAGHIIGSAQIRVEHEGEVWVVSGDYKIGEDPTTTPFEPIPCHTFITEATFGLPIYTWPDPGQEFEALNDWWRANQQDGKASIVFAYALGKAQRVLAGVDASIGPIFVHGAVHKMNAMYAHSGVELPETTYVGTVASRYDWSQALVVAPSSARGTPWMRRFGRQSTAFASGWMRVRGQRRRRSVDRGFILSDHVDWKGLMQSIDDTGAERVLVTHGNIPTVVRFLREEKGRDAYSLNTRFGQDEEDQDTVDPYGAAAGEGES